MAGGFLLHFELDEDWRQLAWAATLASCCDEVMLGSCDCPFGACDESAKGLCLAAAGIQACWFSLARLLTYQICKFMSYSPATAAM